MGKKALKEYRIWKAMKSRCYAPSQGTHGYYQTYNIQVCNRWLHSFDAFMKDMGPIPGPDYSIERIDVYGNYEPKNCKWIPMSEQSKNRTNCLFFTHNGRTECLKEWARIIGVNYTTLYMSITRDKRTFEEAFARYSKQEES